jgi:dipeptidyl aminopeptidase/acylaminoacyl peptidase
LANAAPLDSFVEGLYRPFQGEHVALSPDGRRVAFTRHEKDGLCLYLMTVDDARKVRILVEEDRVITFAREKAPARLRFLRWASSERIIFAPTEHFSGTRWHAPIFAVNPDGSELKKLVDSDDFAIAGPVLDAEGHVITPPLLLPRRTNIRGLRPDKPRLLQIEALGQPVPPGPLRTPIPTALYDVDIYSGKISQQSEQFADGRYGYDQNGDARILYVQPQHSSARHFQHLFPGTWNRWSDLNALVGGDDFSLTVDNYFGHRSYPLGFGRDRDVLYIASNVGRDTFGVYAVNIVTKHRLEFAVEHPHYDLAPLEPAFGGETLVFDERRKQLVGVRSLGLEPLTIWTEPEMASVQREMEIKVPSRVVELLDWNDSRNRFLVRVTGGIEPGRYFIYRRDQNLLTEILQRAPWLKNEDLHEGRVFEFDTPAGLHLTGYLTLPRKPRLNPPPLVINFRAGPLGRETPGFDREAQVLAAMGFVVARINVRGSPGFGVRHRAPMPGGLDRARIDDALATIEWIGRSLPVDRRRIGVMGTGYGGYVALRALQFEPGVFRCAVAVQAPIDVRRWLEPRLNATGPSRVNFHREVQLAAWRHAMADGATRSLLDADEAPKNPLLLVVDPPLDGEILAQNNALRARLKKLGRPPEYFEVSAGFASDLPGARARVFRQVQEFFNLTLYDYNVKVGESKEVK